MSDPRPVQLGSRVHILTSLPGLLRKYSHFSLQLLSKLLRSCPGGGARQGAVTRTLLHVTLVELGRDLDHLPLTSDPAKRTPFFSNTKMYQTDWVTLIAMLLPLCSLTRVRGHVVLWSQRGLQNQVLVYLLALPFFYSMTLRSWFQRLLPPL